MENVTFDLSSLHHYGSAFYDYLRLRKRFFVDTLGWDIPHNAEVEMDQYDNPLAHYSIVIQDGEVIGGARAMATTSQWGSHTYMLGDAWHGKLVDIPQSVMPGDVVTPKVWECTRLVIADEVRTHADRSLCLSLIVDGLIDTARAHGATELMSLSPLSLMRALRQLGYAADRVGEPYRNDGDGRQYAVLAMPAQRGLVGVPTATHRPQPQAVHAPAVA
jgi:acyl homoserine lactone synthase